MPPLLRKPFTIIATGILCLAMTSVALATAVPVHVQRKLAVRQTVHVILHAAQLPEGGYYYGVIVLKPYKKYTRASPPPCSTSSNMQAPTTATHNRTER